MMHQSVPVAVDTPSAKQPIPQHVLDRLESEWQQMRENAPHPSNPPLFKRP
jgi:hypothetical protein